MDYRETTTYLNGLNSLGSKPGLDTISALLSKLGNPQDKLRFVHIAGTNGKGSVGAFLTSILTEAGLNAGRYSSPAVFNPLEIITTGSGEIISPDNFSKIITVIKDTCDIMVSEGLAHPTRFEIETAAAFMYFIQKQCDIVVLECGMGGSLDATNIINNTLCSVITSISIDHTAYLGSTIQEIASHKAGIIKAGGRVVCLYDKKYQEVISHKASQLGNPISYVNNSDITNMLCEKNKGHITFDYKDLKDLQIRLMGTYQPVNGALAVETSMELVNCGFNISDVHIRNGLLKAVWRGRFQFIGHNPDFIIDGAHNPDGAKALEDCIKTYYPKGGITFIIGIFADKDLSGILKHIVPYASHIIATATPDNPRALPAKKLAEYIETYYDIDVKCCQQINTAVNQALYAGSPNAVIACGSLAHLALIEEAYRTLWTEKK